MKIAANITYMCSRIPFTGTVRTVLPIVPQTGFVNKSQSNILIYFFLHFRFSRLTHLNLGTLATNSILKAVSETCSGLLELRLCGGGGGGHCGQSKVGDLGLRYIAGLVPTVGQRVRKLGKD